MSPRALSPCTTPGCPSLVVGGHCPLHRRAKRRGQAAQRRSANDPSMDVYSTTQWMGVRTAYLSLHPWCLDCGAKATQPDHVPPRMLLLALGVHEPDHARWLQPRCATCHARKTRTIDAPLIRRWRNGEDARELCNELLKPRGELGTHFETSMQNVEEVGGPPGVG